MDELKPKLSRYIFGFAALAFLLPFVNFSCADVQVAEVKGIDMVIGSTIGSENPMSAEEMMEAGEGDPLHPVNLDATGTQQVKPNFLAILALGCCVLGLFLSFSESDRVRVVRIWLAVAAGGALLVLRFMIESEIEDQAAGIVQVDTAPGFWVVLALLAGAIWLNYANESNDTSQPFVRARIEPRIIGSQPPKSDVPRT